MGLPRSAVGIIGALVIAGSAACTSGTPREPGPTDDGREVATSAACIRAQGAWAWRLQSRVQKVMQRVLSDPEQTSDDGAVLLRQVLGAIEHHSLRRCGSGGTPLVPLIELAYSRDDQTLDAPLLREVIDAFEEWASVVGEPRAGRIVYAAKPCEAMRDAVDARYTLRRRPEPGGTTAWFEFRVTSDWNERLMLTHSGMLRVTGLAPDGESKRLWWGGSSYDSASVGRGRTVRFASWPVGLPDEFVHLLPGGTVRASRLSLGAYGHLIGCEITLRRAR